MAPDRMSPVRLFISDIDGTLLRSDKQLSEAVVAAVRRLESAGVAMSLISARPPSGLLPIAKQLGLSNPIAAFNGGTIINPDGTIESAVRLDVATAERALSLIARPNVHVWLFSAGRWYVEHLGSSHDDSERQTADQEPAVVESFAPLLAQVDKIVAVSDDYDLLETLEGTVAVALGDNATVIRSQPYYLDITASAANKGDGVAALARAMGVPLDNVAVIGDQGNDVAMFARAGLSIAMGQGPEPVRAAAKHVTTSNDHDGVAHAIETIVLPRAKVP